MAAALQAQREMEVTEEETVTKRGYTES